MAEEGPVSVSVCPEELLSQAAAAWTSKNVAESQLARLKRYQRLNPSMREDRDRYEQQLADAIATLNRIFYRLPQ